MKQNLQSCSLVQKEFPAIDMKGKKEKCLTKDITISKFEAAHYKKNVLKK